MTEVLLEEMVLENCTGTYRGSAVAQTFYRATETGTSVVTPGTKHGIGVWNSKGGHKYEGDYIWGHMHHGTFTYAGGHRCYALTNVYVAIL
jgi:hypothetical protein